MLKGMKTITMLVLVLLMSVSGSEVFADRDNSNRNNNGDNGRHVGQRGGRDKVLAMVRQSDAGKAEIERHRKAMEALKEEGQKLREQIKSEVQEKMRKAHEDGEEINREELLAEYEQQVRAHASKMFNEAITHRQNLLNIAKSMENEIIDKYMEMRKQQMKRNRPNGGQSGDHRQNPGHRRPDRNRDSED